MSKEAILKKLELFVNEVTSTLSDMVVQFVDNSFEVLSGACRLGSLQILLELYIWTSLVVIRFQILSQQLDGFLFVNKQATPLEGGSPLLEHDEVDVIIGEQFPEIDEAILFPCYSMPESVILLIFNSLLYRLCYELSEV